MARPALPFRYGNPVRILTAVPRRGSARAVFVAVVRAMLVLVVVFGGKRRRGVSLMDRSCLLIRLRRM